jgi:hypothetical protein
VNRNPKLSVLIAVSLLAVSALACATQTEKVIVVTATHEPQQVAQVTTASPNTPPQLPTATLVSVKAATPTPAANARPTLATSAPPKPTAVVAAPTPTDISRVPPGSTGQGIAARFIFPGYSLNAKSDLTFRLLAYRDDGPKTDGAGIQQVEFRICRNDCNDDKNVVYSRTEQNAAYCAFGGGEPNCTIFHFTRVTNWPGTNTSVQSGNYVVEARVRPKDGNAYWQGQLEFKISLP